MDPRDVDLYKQLVEFQSRMLQAAIMMNAMKAENEFCTQQCQGLKYGEDAFTNLIADYGIGPNDFACIHPY